MNLTCHFRISKEPVSLCFMALIKDMISCLKIQPLKAPFLVHLIATDYSEMIYDAKENINPFWEIRAYTLVLSELIFQKVATEITFFVNFQFFLFFFFFF